MHCSCERRSLPPDVSVLAWHTIAPATDPASEQLTNPLSIARCVGLQAERRFYRGYVEPWLRQLLEEAQEQRVNRWVSS